MTDVARTQRNELPGKDPLAAARLSPMLVASWERSLKHGLRRHDHALFNSSVTKAVERRVVDENQRLLTHASSEMVRLYTGLGSARWVSLCVNALGQVVCSVGDRTAAPREIRTLMHPGRSLLETELGTTAPGCALEVGRSVVVTRGEHFLLELSSFFCACAPIHSPGGQLAGALDITGVDVQSLPLANDMVALAARAIENSMLLDLGNCSLFSFHFDERLLGTPFQAMLAIDADGIVRGANRAARQLLLVPGAQAAPGTYDSLFEGKLSELHDHARLKSHESLKVRTRSGALAYLRLEPPTPRGRPQPPAACSSTTRVLAGGRLFVLKDESLRKGFERAVSMFRHGLPILLEGETGTGKEVFARALQEAARPEGRFVALNCAAIPEGLIEAELFGYADGAFTGGRRGGAAGKIEQAHGGVLFLDEIGDMALALQSRLLRVLQERVVTRVGDSREIPVDILVLSATHSRLEQLVASKEFREDLFYRLNGCTLRLPPLRERDDVAELVTELLLHCDALQHDGVRSNLDDLIAPNALECLVSARWPGNIRQLEQTVRGLLALRVPPAPIDIYDLPEALRTGTDASHIPAVDTEGGSLLDAAQESLIRKVLSEHGGNVSAAARVLGISRTTLYAKLKRTTTNGVSSRPLEP